MLTRHRTVPAASTNGNTAAVTGSDANPTASDTSTSPSSTNGATKMGASASIFAGLALLGAFLA